MMAPYSIFEGLGDLLVAVRRICWIDVGGWHRGDVEPAGLRRGSLVTAAQRRASTERSLGQPSLGQSELSCARGAAKVSGRVCTNRWVPSYLAQRCAGHGRRFQPMLLRTGSFVLHRLGSASQTRPSSRLAARRDMENRQETKSGLVCSSVFLVSYLAAS